MKDRQSRKTLENKSELAYSSVKNESELLGKNDFDLYPYDTAIISVNEDKEVIRSGEPILNKETKSIRNDGSESRFLTSKNPFVNEKEEVEGIIGISYDISARKLMEQQSGKLS